MTDNIRRRATIRKVSYFGLILALFTLSMFWRGLIGLPIGNAARAAQDAPNGMARTGDRIARLPILKQADELELRELDSGDPEVAGSAARHSMLGLQGIVITVLWSQAIEKQKRGEYHDFELLVNVVTELQPNFVQPWLFQSWNISYNVSVENDKLGDMYFYIARGIDLLAKGDRRNTKVYRGVGETSKVGSPDIRFTIGFYYQNKFSVSDKVDVLRSLMHVSSLKPSERDPDTLMPNGQIDEKKFRDFCERNPQFVRRLQAKLNRKSPAAVVDFLRTNQQIPTRYDIDNKNLDRKDLLVSDESQFPIFPPQFVSKQRQLTGRDETNDSFDAFLAARAWYEYAQSIVPPPVEGEPTSAPRRGEYDEYKYRIPTKPMLILFRMQPSRSQTYLAEFLQKEGWFDETTRWNPDELVDSGNAWFAKGNNPPMLIAAKGSTLAADSASAIPVSSFSAYTDAHAMWEDYGRMNGLILTPTQLFKYGEDAAKTSVLGSLGGQIPDLTDDQLATLGLKREWIKARKALQYYQQNLSVSNFPFFLSSTEAEASREMVEARKLLWEANRSFAAAKTSEAVRLFTEANAKWRLALLKHDKFHNGERNDSVQEVTADMEVKLMKLLVDERKVPAVKLAIQALVPQVGETVDRDLTFALAEIETSNRIALELLKTINPAAPPESIQGDGEYAYLKYYTTKTRDIPWVNPRARDGIKVKEGMMRQPAAPPMPSGPGTPGDPRSRPKQLSSE